MDHLNLDQPCLTPDVTWSDHFYDIFQGLLVKSPKSQAVYVNGVSLCDVPCHHFDSLVTVRGLFLWNDTLSWLSNTWKNGR